MLNAGYLTANRRFAKIVGVKKIECSFMIDEDAAELLLQLAGGPRKRGEYLSALIRERARGAPLLDRVSELERELAKLRTAIVEGDIAGPPPPPGRHT